MNPNLRIQSIREMAAMVRSRREELGLSQMELALKSGTSRRWIIDLEKGKPTLEIGLLIPALGVLGLHLYLLPDDKVPAANPGQRGTGDIDLRKLLRPPGQTPDAP